MKKALLILVCVAVIAVALAGIAHAPRSIAVSAKTPAGEYSFSSGQKEGP